MTIVVAKINDGVNDKKKKCWCDVNVVLIKNDIPDCKRSSGKIKAESSKMSVIFYQVR